MLYYVSMYISYVLFEIIRKNRLLSGSFMFLYKISHVLFYAGTARGTKLHNYLLSHIAIILQVKIM